jgi:hypothetical protein
MRVLVACEFSGAVRDAFAARGHDAWSCDELPGRRRQSKAGKLGCIACPLVRIARKSAAGRLKGIAAAMADQWGKVMEKVA